jgi:hypothetical protein
MDTVGEDTVAAVETLVAEGSGRTLMQWIHAAGPSEAASTLRRIATSDKAVRQLLLAEPVDRLEARALLEELDASSVDTLLDVLADAGTKGTRLLVRQRLAEFGNAIAPQLIARLGDGPWYVVRNVLSLLHDSAERGSDDAAAADTIFALLGHAQAQVRIEALRVLVRMDGARRIAALSRALRDESERVVLAALQDMADAKHDHDALGPALAAAIMALVDSGAHSEPVRGRAVRALACTRSDAVRDWLIGLVSRKTMILRRLTLVDPTQTAASALHVLTRVYADDPAAARVLAAAQRVSGEPRWQVRDAVNTMERAAS